MKLKAGLIWLLTATLLAATSCRTHKSDGSQVKVSSKNKLPGNKVKIKDIKDEECVEVKSKPDFLFEFVTMNNLSQVLEHSKNLDKPVFLDINAKWCLPCKLMQRDVYTHKETAAFFNEHFISYMVDMETGEGPDLKLIYDIKMVPTLLWLDSKGRVLVRKEGACYHEELLGLAATALKTTKQ